MKIEEISAWRSLRQKKFFQKNAKNLIEGIDKPKKMW